MIKRLLKGALSCLLVLSMGFPCVLAEGEDTTYQGYDFSDTGYWTSLCTGKDILTSEQKASCSAFMNYMSSRSTELQQRIKEIEAERAQAEKDVLAYAAQVADYQSQADALNGQIADLNSQIADKQGQIDVLNAKVDQLEKDIETRQGEIDAAEAKIKDRMVVQQKTMRLNKYLDVLMGARSLDEFIRVSNALRNVTAYDEKVMADLSDQIDALAADKEEVEATKKQVEDEQANIETLRQSVVDQQNQLLALKYQAQQAEQLVQDRMADLEAQGNTIAGDIANIQSMMAEMQSKLNEVAATAGWTYPVPGAHISAGTWAYDTGGVHLGEDFAAPLGTAIYAAGNGVVLNSADGCGYGYLGNGCGSASGGSWGGGNQVYLLTKINGGLYAVKYLHMLAGTPIAKGSIVSAGQQIGQVGSSGSSTGPHCHVEIFYLGDASNFASYAASWNGDLSFGCGWGSAALSRKCESGVGAPCRYRPEAIFGG